MAAAPLILIVEDDPDIAEVVRLNLAREGLRVIHADCGERALAEVQRATPSLVVLDLMLPGIDGLEVCRRLRSREETLAVPTLILSAKGEESDVVVGLELGADDYLPKPFRGRELVARVRSLLRRAALASRGEEPARVELYGLVIDARRHEVTLNGEPVPLTRAEFRLLWTLANRPGRVFERAELVDRITAGEALIVDRNVDVHVSSIRKKLGGRGDLIATVRGVGYKCRD
jgi:two-component system phosphate regulon response regulator PhoB